MERAKQKRTRETSAKKSERRKSPAGENICVISKPQLTYDILRLIFKYLNAKDLCSATMVCRSWLEAATKELKLRRPEIFFPSDLPMADKPNVNTLSEKLSCKPVLALFFSNMPLSDCETEEQDVSAESFRYWNALPKTCCSLYSASIGVIFDNNEVVGADDLHPEGLMSGAFFSEIPGVKSKVMVFEKDFRLVPNGPSYHKSNFGQIVLDNKVNCIMVLCNDQTWDYAKVLLLDLKARYAEESCSIWGGVTPSLICNGAPSCCAFVLFNGDGLHSWSTIIKKKYATKEQVEKKLREMKQHVRLKKHSMGFMFACCERGEHAFDEKNVEATIFKKVFPKVPLVGSIGNGEFGIDSFQSHKSQSPSIFHVFSTAFLIMTYG